ncbi:hypothetical protein RF11_13735 [Thelohanellus kitauei]|uniref:Uncharacterized protein n=1 Tax=Thelohanellus kitauei TaxID=669202 RepID=A0A0C2J4D7_THEKT|nr:hypothetical protein RF11_06056 [Thelohanellus kitauei]KII63937.1 hypothetical protein RF11_13735 [Thelohanellus kitauei]
MRTSSLLSKCQCELFSMIRGGVATLGFNTLFSQCEWQITIMIDGSQIMTLHRCSMKNELGPLNKLGECSSTSVKGVTSLPLVNDNSMNVPISIDICSIRHRMPKLISRTPI